MMPSDPSDRDLWTWFHDHASVASRADLAGSVLERARRTPQRGRLSILVRGTDVLPGELLVPGLASSLVLLGTLLLLAALAASAVVLSSPQPPPITVRNGYLATSELVSAGSPDDPASYLLDFIEPDGSTIWMGNHPGSCPTISPDGRSTGWFARGEDGLVHAMRGGVRGQDEAEGIAIDGRPLGFSPSLRYALVVSPRAGAPDAAQPAAMSSAWVLSNEDGGRVPIGDDGSNGHLVALGWSRDDRHLALIRGAADGSTSLLIANGDGSDPRPITMDGLSPVAWSSGMVDVAALPTLAGTDIAWAPDGSRLAFAARDETGQTDLFSVRADGSGVVRITDDAAVEAMPSWSPGGRTIAYLTLEADASSGRVSTVAADPAGAVPSPVVGLVHAISVSWSPDGAWLLLLDPPVEQRWISTTDRGTGPLYQLTYFDPNLRSYEHPLFSWGPVPPVGFCGLSWGPALD